MQVPDIEVIDLSKYVEIRLFGERPHIRGRRVPVATLAYSAHQQERTPSQLAEDFSLTEGQVLAALLYYAEHHTEIDAQEANEQVAFDREAAR